MPTKEKSNCRKAANEIGGRKLAVLDIPEMEGVEMAKTHDFFQQSSVTGSILQVLKSTRKHGVAQDNRMQFKSSITAFDVCNGICKMDSGRMTNDWDFCRLTQTIKPILPMTILVIKYMNQAVTTVNKYSRLLGKL